MTAAPQPTPASGRTAWTSTCGFTSSRLRSYRLPRARQTLDAPELGALLVFDTNAET
jgi:hypothetical protein